MNISPMYILIAIAVLLVIASIVFSTGRHGTKKNLTPLAGLAFGFVLAGMVFGENRLIGYSLMGMGVLLAVLDVLRNRNKTT